MNSINMFRTVTRGPLIAIAALCPCWAAFAQLSVTSLLVDPLAFSLSSFPGFALSNTSGQTVVSGELVITSASGELEATMRTTPFSVGPGMRMFRQGEVQVAEFRTANTEAGALLLREQRLAGGQHECCLMISVLNGDQQALPYCEGLVVDEDLWLDLVEPWDGDTVDSPRPMLAWTVLGRTGLPKDVQARLVLVPNDRGGKAQALASTTPVFVVDGAPLPAVPFPAGQPDLIAGHCYAWQVEAWRGSSFAGRTEPWRFCVRKTLQIAPEKYVLLRSDGAKSIYQVVDGYIYFRTDDTYAVEALECVIQSGNGERIVPVVVRENGGVEQPGAKKVGVNLYEFDLQPYHLKTGQYRLKVRDGVGRGYDLQFKYNR